MLKSKHSCQEAHDENNRRRREEKLYGFPSMFQWMDDISLKRIDIARDDWNDHRCDDVVDGRMYLIGYNGRWVLSKARKDYHKNWTFNTGHSSTNLGHLDILFEVAGLTGYDAEPLSRLPYPSEEEYCEHCGGECCY